MAETILIGEAQWLREQGMITRAEEERLKLMVRGDDADFNMALELMKSKYRAEKMTIPYRLNQIEFNT